MAMLKRLTLNGFRSVKNAEIEFRELNVLIGANGAGKSNLIAFFKMLSELSVGHLQTYLGDTGRASGNLHFGPKTTPQLSAELEQLELWLEDYSLGEIWEKNVIGGGPH